MIHFILIGRKLAMWSANDPENRTAWCDSFFCKRSDKKDGLVWLTPCDTFFLFLQMVRQKGRPGATLLFCKCSGTSVCAGLLQKRCFGATTFIANYEQHHDGPASCHAIADGIVFANIIRIGRPLAERMFCQNIFLYSDRICKIFEEPVARKRRSSGRH